LITINSEKNIYNEEIGFGVSIQPPITFKKAKSFLGFQAPNKMGSISLEMDETYEQLKAAYSEESIDAREGKLYRNQPVSYAGNKDAFYVEFYDKPQKRYRLVLVIKKEKKTYHLKCFHRGKADHPLSNKIRISLLTTHIGDFQNEEKPFSKVFLEDLENITYKYTRDNKLPTEEPDSLIVLIRSLEKGVIQKYKERDFLEQKVNSITNCKTSTSTEPLENGQIFKCISRTESKHVLGILLVLDNNESTLIQCIGNEKTDLREISNIMLSQFVSIM
jgi:hypothetical protein